MNALVQWDDNPLWGVVGFNVHESDWVSDGKHDDGVSDQ